MGEWWHHLGNRSRRTFYKQRLWEVSMEFGAFRWQGYTEPQTKSSGTFTSPPLQEARPYT